MRSEQRSADRVERLSHSVNIAAKLLPLVDDPDVAAVLERIEDGIIQRMISAKTSEDRDAAAAEINALRRVWGHLKRIAYSGKHALQTIERIKEQTHAE